MRDEATYSRYMLARVQPPHPQCQLFWKHQLYNERFYLILSESRCDRVLISLKQRKDNRGNRGSKSLWSWRDFNFFPYHRYETHLTINQSFPQHRNLNFNETIKRYKFLFFDYRDWHERLRDREEKREADSSNIRNIY